LQKLFLCRSRDRSAGPIERDSFRSIRRPRREARESERRPESIPSARPFTRRDENWLGVIAIKRARGSSRSLAAKATKDVRGTPCGVTRRKYRGAQNLLKGSARTAEAGCRRRTGGSRIAWATRFGTHRDEGLVVEKESCGLQISVERTGIAAARVPRGARARSSLGCARTGDDRIERAVDDLLLAERIGGAARAGSFAKPDSACGSRPLDTSASS
jgi:hypothetical protein